MFLGTLANKQTNLRRKFGSKVPDSIDSGKNDMRTLHILNALSVSRMAIRTFSAQALKKPGTFRRFLRYIVIGASALGIEEKGRQRRATGDRYSDGGPVD